MSVYLFDLLMLIFHTDSLNCVLYVKFQFCMHLHQDQPVIMIVNLKITKNVSLSTGYRSLNRLTGVDRSNHSFIAEKSGGFRLAKMSA